MNPFIRKQQSGLMRIQALLCALCLMLTGKLFSQRVYPVYDSLYATAMVEIVDDSLEADLFVWRAPTKDQSQGNHGWWYFSAREHEGDRKIFYVQPEERSDFKVFFVADRASAGWRNRRAKVFFEDQKPVRLPTSRDRYGGFKQWQDK